ncbi:MAG: Hpt domain-containing protein [Xanthobacteraceae bacterium]|nr:MAG: Hpt domain-containing protein [Xanthobacteraceae bacterium]
MSALRKRIDWMPSPPLAPHNPAYPDGPLDGEHLSRMTLGQRDLEHEVLGLFLNQMDRVMDLLSGLGADSAVLAHTLKGAALSIGAFGVAEAARGFEAAVRQGGATVKASALTALRESVGAARAAIEARLRQP